MARHSPGASFSRMERSTSWITARGWTESKITYAEAAERRVNLLKRLQGRDWTPADIEAYDGLVTESENALNDLRAAEGRVMEFAGGEARFIETAVKLMRRQSQVAHRQFVLDIMGRPAAERAQLLQQYESDLRALLDHYSKRENVPKEADHVGQRGPRIRQRAEPHRQRAGRCAGGLRLEVQADMGDVRRAGQYP